MSDFNKTISGDDVLEMSRQQFSNETHSEFLRGIKQGTLKAYNKIIDLVRKMPNADDRYDKFCKGAIPKMLDGGSVHRFTLIKELEKIIKELEE